MANEPTLSWREHAVARSLDSARLRAEHRVQRFLDAALELMSDSESGKEFTVQEVVERSGQSLRSFYQYFDGKQELLLALFEESVRSAADDVRAAVDEEPDACARLHRFVIEYYALCRPVRSRKGAKRGASVALAEFAQQLMTDHPSEARRAYAPLVSMFEGLLDDAVGAGVVRPGLPRRRVAGVVLEAIMFNAFSTTIGGRPAQAEGADPAEELWDLLFHGIAA